MTNVLVGFKLNTFTFILKACHTRLYNMQTRKLPGILRMSSTRLPHFRSCTDTEGGVEK